MNTPVSRFIKALVRFALTTVFFYLAFWFLFHFENRQALGLGLTFAFGMNRMLSKMPAEQAVFAPHRMTVEFHSYRMLFDLGLLTDPEQWSALIGEPPSPWSWGPTSVCHYGVTGFCLSSKPSLVHFPELRSYREHWTLQLKLTPLQIPGAYVPWSPEVFVKLGSGGYNLGLRVNAAWWKERKGAVAPGVVLEEDDEWNYGTTCLVLAVLPYDVEHEFYRSPGASGKENETQLKELISKNAWKNTDLGNEDIGYFGEAYEHTYFTVWVQPLPR